MYHKVDIEAPTMWWVTANNFYRQMLELVNKEVVYLDDYDINNRNHVVITFDGIYDGVLKYAAPILKKFNYPFELFLTSEYIGLDNSFDVTEPFAKFVTADELKLLLEYGGRLQWHTKSHLNLKEITDSEIIRSELDIPKRVKELDVKGFKWFAYPHGELNKCVLSQVKLLFSGALSCNQGDNSIYQLNRITVTNETTLRKNKVACIIASYNYGDFLIEAIESVLTQTLLPDEILISDDHSMDDTELIAKGYAKKYPKLIRYNRNSKNLGIIDHFNSAIKLIKSEFVFFLGADNKLQSDYIEKTFQVLDSNSKIGIAYTDYSFFGDNAKLAYLKIGEVFQGEIIDNKVFQINFPEFDCDKALKEHLKNGNFIHGSSMFRLSAFIDVGGYMKSGGPEDYNLFKRMIESNWRAKKASTNLEYRQHSHSQANNIVIIHNKLLFYKNAYEKLLKENQSVNYSMPFKMTLILFKLLYFVKKNYRKPKLIISKIYNKLKRISK